jgi:hypothetical protein
MTASPKEKTAQQQAGRIEAQLDAALADSFPASDPVSIVTSQTEEYWRAEDDRSAPQPGTNSSPRPPAR